jgi:glycosyltransferase involved in cell wall biosynthesis
MAVLTVILPTKNEVANIGSVIRDIQALSLDIDIIVVDSSDDGTSELAESLGAIVIKETRKGIGFAFKKGLEASCTDVVMLIDADCTYPLDALVTLAYFDIKHFNTDMVMGYRQWRQRGAMSLLHGIGNFGLSLMASILYGKWVKDLCTGYWIMRKTTVQKFDLRGESFLLVVDLWINSIKYGVRLKQAPIDYLPRKDRGSKISVRTGFELGKFIIQERFRR